MKTGAQLYNGRKKKMTPAEIILDQLGGDKFISMTGCTNIFQSNEGQTLSMHLPKNESKAKYLRITLTDDLYLMEFLGVKQKRFHGDIYTVEKYEDVYDDMLQEIFTEVTGLYTSL